MRYIPRLLETHLKKAARNFPAVILTGPRRAGKTTLLRALFPEAGYYLLEDPDVISRVRTDPRTFLEEIQGPTVLDEVQNVPEVLSYVRTRIDRYPNKKGQWFLTGSQEASLMKGITESLAGRAAVFQLLPFSLEEFPRASLMKGGFPEVVSRPASASIWFRSYVQTYLERDVRTASSIRDLATFRRFLSLVASRCGQITNRTDLAGPLGVSVPTISGWLSILEITGQIVLVPPFFENFGKRLTKSPKLYFVDSGLACHLLGIESEKMLNRSTFLGPLFEGYVASEILKHQTASGRRKELYHFRDQQGLEVDFVVPQGNGKLLLIEAKASRTLSPEMGESLDRLERAIDRYRVTKVLMHRSGKEPEITAAVRAGVRALTPEKLGSVLSVGAAAQSAPCLRSREPR